MDREQVTALVTLAGSGFEGDADEAVEAFSEDAVLLDRPGEPLVRGRDELLEFFLAFGGRRARFQLRDLVVDGDRAAVVYELWLRSDATAYVQRGMALLRLGPDGIHAWQGVWVQGTEDDLRVWAGD